MKNKIVIAFFVIGIGLSLPGGIIAGNSILDVITYSIISSIILAGWVFGLLTFLETKVPEFTDFLVDINERMYDLADSIKEGFYVHPLFRGSWSIKNVLPVMVSNLSYKNFTVNKGDQAMITWWEMINNSDTSASETAKDLLEYCKLDTFAMVEIWKQLKIIAVSSK